MAPDVWFADFYRIGRLWLTRRWRQRNRWNDWTPLDEETP